MRKKRNGKIVRIIALDEFGLPRNDPDYLNKYMKIGRQLNRIPPHFQEQIDGQIEELRTLIKHFINV